MDAPTQEALARIADNLTILLDRMLVLAVAVAISGGVLLVLFVLLFLRLSSLEESVTTNSRTLAAKIVRSLGDRISDLDLPPAPTPAPPPRPPKSRRGG